MRDRILQVAREARDRSAGCARRTPTGAALLNGPPEPLILACFETHGYESGLDPAFVREVIDDLAYEALAQPVEFTLEQLEYLVGEVSDRASQRDLVGALLRAIPPPVPVELEYSVLSLSGTHRELVAALLKPVADPWAEALSGRTLSQATKDALLVLVRAADDAEALAELALKLRRGKVFTAAVERLAALPGGGAQLARVPWVHSSEPPPADDEAARRRWFERMLRDGTSWRYEDDPIARELIWLVDGAPALRPAPGAEVRLWHPAEGSAGVVVGEQPIAQASREVYGLADVGRFAGRVLAQPQLNALARSRGWSYAAGGAWEGTAPAARLSLPLVDVELLLEPVRGETTAGVFTHVRSGGLRFSVPPEQLPPRLLSEILRDVDLFVSVSDESTDKGRSKAP